MLFVFIFIYCILLYARYWRKNGEVKLSKLDPHLHCLLRDMISLDDNKKQENTMILQKVLNELLDEMKRQSHEFKMLFQGLQYGGSFYENLRVKNPNEFDINAELCLPIKDKHIKIIRSGPGFVKVQVSSLEFSPYTDSEVIRRVCSWFDEEYYLQRTKVMRWMQSVVDTALHKAKIPSGVQVSRTISGPAITLVVKVKGQEFSVDLVPVFGFGVSKWPSRPFRQRHNIPYLKPSEEKYFVVPKSPEYFYDYPSLWRVSFPTQERQMINDLGNIKPVLKLVKKLRDEYNWKGLSSYYIKTIFMWELEKQNKEFWYQSLGVLYLHMLDKVKEAFHKRQIDFFWDRKLNLLQDMSPGSMKNAENCISRIRMDIISHLNDDPSLVFEIYGYDKISISAAFIRVVHKVTVAVMQIMEVVVPLAIIICVLSLRENSSDQET